MAGLPRGIHFGASLLLTEALLIDLERRVLLRHYLEQGLPKAEIARQLGISRETIYAMIRDGELDRDPLEARYGPRPPVPHSFGGRSVRRWTSCACPRACRRP